MTENRFLSIKNHFNSVFVLCSINIKNLKVYVKIEHTRMIVVNGMILVYGYEMKMLDYFK